MTSATPATSSPSLPVEAARYALFRRIAFAMRHDMVAHLQPIGMVTELVERRLRAPSPDMALVQEGVSKINGFSKAAVQSCLDVITWLAPDPGRTVAIGDGARETINLLRSNLNFRGFALRDELGEMPEQVGRAALRHVLPASLLLLTDTAGAPAEIVLSAQADAAQVRLQLALEPSDGPEGMPGELAYRRLSPDEVKSLAQAEGIGFRHEGDTIVLTLPR